MHQNFRIGNWNHFDLIIRLQLNTPVMADISNTAPYFSPVPNAFTLMVYSLFEVNPVMVALVSCTSGKSPSLGETATKYCHMICASPFKNGSSQLILIDDSVTLLMMDERGLSKTMQQQSY